jgi:hypothetical protein
MPSFHQYPLRVNQEYELLPITKPVILPKWIQVCTNQFLNPFTTFSDKKQQKIRQNKQIFRQDKAKYIVFLGFIWRHKFDGGSTLNRDTVIQVN